MTLIDYLGLLAAVSAATLGGVAINYALFALRHQPHGRLIGGLRLLWAGVAWWYAAIWTIDAFDPPLDQALWLRPVAWAVFGLPTLTMLRAFAADRATLKARKALASKLGELERTLNGQP